MFFFAKAAILVHRVIGHIYQTKHPYDDCGKSLVRFGPVDIDEKIFVQVNRRRMLKLTVSFVPGEL